MVQATEESVKKENFIKRQLENRIKFEGDSKKDKIIRVLKFFLLPGFRPRELNNAEYEIGKIKSKRQFFRRFMTPLTILGLLCILFITWCAIFPWWATKYHITFITEYSASSFDPGIFDWDPPMPGHPLGLAQGGWDVLARSIWSSRYSLMVSFQSVTIGFIVGIIVGVLSAFAGGWVDNILMRIADIFILFPSLLLAFLFITIWGNEMQTIMIALAIDDIPVYARIARASTLQEKSKLYVDAGRTAGASNFKLMFKHILPNAMSPLIVRVSFHLAVATLSLGGLAFLGFAVGKVPTWGFDIGFARRWMLTAPHAMFWPGVWIFLSALGFQLVGDGLRDALDPKLKII